MVIECGRHQIRPYNSNCWEIWELRKVKPREGGETREEWRSMGKYPGSLASALPMVFEMEMRQRGGDAVVRIDDAMTVAREVADQLVRAAEEASSRV